MLKKDEMRRNCQVPTPISMLPIQMTGTEDTGASGTFYESDRGQLPIFGDRLVKICPICPHPRLHPVSHSSIASYLFI